MLLRSTTVLLGFLLVLAVSISSKASPIFEIADDLSAKWESFKKQFGKQYSSVEEEIYRRKAWEKSLKFIEGHNRLYERGIKKFKIDGTNEFADMYFEEFRAQMAMPDFVPGETNAIPYRSLFPDEPRFALPTAVDWRTKGVVSEPKHQGKCGCCYAFSSVAALESHWLMYSGKTKTLVSLSQQELVDCSKKQNNNGCHGGSAQKSYDYIKSNGRISKDETYPYIHAENPNCLAKKTNDTFGASITGYIETLHRNENDMKEAVASKGPLAITFHVTNAFHLFSGDSIYDDDACATDSVNHALTAVGYGTSPDGIDYWIVKNSWGPTWGDHGFAKIRRGKNTCAIALYGGVYPLVK